MFCSCDHHIITFQSTADWLCTSWFRQVALSNGRSVPAVLLANKCDQRRQGLCPKLPKLENFSREYGFVGWYETSAKVRRDCLRIRLLVGRKSCFKVFLSLSRCRPRLYFSVNKCLCRFRLTYSSTSVPLFFLRLAVFLPYFHVWFCQCLFVCF